MSRNTLDLADDFDLSPILPKIASFARKHDVIARVIYSAVGGKAHHVLLVNRTGDVKTVRTMRACCEWLGY